MTSPNTSVLESASEKETLSVAPLLEKLRGRWTLQIMLCLNRDAHRFSDLSSAIPQITAPVLTRRLRDLEREGLIRRNYLPPPAARHVYELAASAAGLRPALDALATWQSDEFDMSSPAPGADSRERSNHDDPERSRARLLRQL
jgi:DNA-binding HxlR family transcriptional regulator